MEKCSYAVLKPEEWKMNGRRYVLCVKCVGEPWAEHWRFFSREVAEAYGQALKDVFSRVIEFKVREINTEANFMPRRMNT